MNHSNIAVSLLCIIAFMHYNLYQVCCWSAACSNNIGIRNTHKYYYYRNGDEDGDGEEDMDGDKDEDSDGDGDEDTDRDSNGGNGGGNRRGQRK